MIRLAIMPVGVEAKGRLREGRRKNDIWLGNMHNRTS